MAGLNPNEQLSASRLPRAGSARTAGYWHVILALLIAGAVLFSAAPAVQASDPIEYGYRDFAFPGGVGSNAPTGEKPESKLWWNDGYWWASMWSTSGDAYHIHRLNLATQDWIDTGTAIDDREASRADALWDGQHLYVVSHIFSTNTGTVSAGQRGELYRYSYNTSTDTYSLDFGPVEVNDARTETLVLAKASNGQLWITYVVDGDVMVNHSTTDDATWSTPFLLPVSGSEAGNDDVSSIIAFDDHVGIMWSNQRSSPRMYFAKHNINDAATVWSGVTAYTVSGDDHMSLKALESDSAGNVYAAIKTSNTSALIVLLVCAPSASKCSAPGDWTSHTVYNSAAHNPTRPIMLIDTSNRDLYIFTRNEDSNNNEGIYYKSTSLDNIQFSPSSIGTPFIRSDTNMDVNINDPTSTKQNVNSTTGLVVLASDSSERRYYHNYRSLSGIQYSLTVNTTGTGSGSVTLDPPGGFYDEGTNVTLTATAAPGSVFSGWSGDLTGTTNPGNIVMNGNKSVTATFTQVPQYTLDVNISGSGTVALDPPGGVYNQGTTVTLTATPQAGWEFTGWGGALAGTTNPTTIVMDANKTVSANFQPVQTYLLTVNTVGSGNVELTPPGPIYNEGAVVSLLAQPAPGWRFTGWSGDLSGTTNPQSLTMDSDKTVTATFVAEYTLTVNAVGSGNVTVDPPNGPYLAGTQVTLTANPAPSWVFSGWSGDATGSTNPVTITMDGDKEVTATFALPDYTLTVNTVGSGSVALSPPGGQYEDGTLVTLTATPDPGWAFSGWSGDILSGMNNPATIRMDNNYTVVATFSPTSPVTHTLTVDIVGSGDVTLDPPGGSYGPGTMVTLTADANSGWRFSGWSGDLSGTTNPASLTMDANKAVIATFVQNEPGIDLDVSTSALTMTEGGTITYTYRVTNIGEAVLNNVALVDDHHGAIPLAIATLASGEAVTAQLVYSIRHVDLPGPLMTTTTVTAASPLGEEVSDSETVAINLIPLPFAYYMPFGLSFSAPAPPGVNAYPDAFVFMSSNRVQSAGAAQMPGAAAQLAHRRR